MEDESLRSLTKYCPNLEELDLNGCIAITDRYVVVVVVVVVVVMAHWQRGGVPLGALQQTEATGPEELHQNNRQHSY